eukprot:6209197-Pleurochrysis_carterae.AAC.3
MRVLLHPPLATCQTQSRCCCARVRHRKADNFLARDDNRIGWNADGQSKMPVQVGSTKLLEYPSRLSRRPCLSIPFSLAVPTCEWPCSGSNRDGLYNGTALPLAETLPLRSGDLCILARPAERLLLLGSRCGVAMSRCWLPELRCIAAIDLRAASASKAEERRGGTCARARVTTCARGCATACADVRACARACARARSRACARERSRASARTPAS